MYQRLTIGLAAFLLAAVPAAADFGDFNDWTLVEDPADPLFSASVDSATQVTLTAGDGPVGSGVDIGYASTDTFSPDTSFAVAVDYDFSVAPASIGGIAIGFGIGESASGENSAGVVFGSQSLAFGGGTIRASIIGVAARVNDIDRPADNPDIVRASATGSFIIEYDATTGSITVGVGEVGETSLPDGLATFVGIQNEWNDADLLASFFLRSDSTGGSAWTSGSAAAVFSDPRFIPEPTGIVILTALGVLVAGFRRSRSD